MLQKLWGDWYNFDAQQKVWTDCRTDRRGKSLERACCQFIWTPIQCLCHTVSRKDAEKPRKMLRAMGVDEGRVNQKQKEVGGA
mmetsp:Transcript_17261/g.37675  ORF Transcript_17261/g.37675 Transcript_17261/m.37675 type:complete len:83 (-) Transcript_17261:396-644(-)